MRAQKLLERIDRKIETWRIWHVTVIHTVVHLHFLHRSIVSIIWAVVRSDNGRVGEFQREVCYEVGAGFGIGHLQKLLCKERKAEKR